MPKKGYKQSDVTKAKMKEAWKYRIISPEHRAKINITLRSEEYRLKNSKSHRGKRKPLSENTKTKISLGLMGCKSYKWKGGRFTENGYIRVKRTEHLHCNYRGYVLEHRLIMEEFLGRYLRKEEVVHHINKDLKDNRPENLMLFENNAAHIKYHALLRNEK